MFNPQDLFSQQAQQESLQWWVQQVADTTLVDENNYAKTLRDALKLTPEERQQLFDKTKALVEHVRENSGYGDGLDAFLKEYSLDTQEGIILMCLAEALLRIPDRQTADALIKDKLSGADWSSHFKKSDSALVNASTWGLILTGKIILPDQRLEEHPASLLHRMVSKLGEPMVRSALYAAMRIMGKQFVLGRSIREALKASEPDWERGHTHSYDMLGEAALTDADAKRYYQRYLDAITAIGETSHKDHLAQKPSISIKLSALHPRFEVAQSAWMLPELLEKMQALLCQAREQGVAVSIDAEEMTRLELTLQFFETLYRSDSAKGWGELGLVVQAYSKRALPVLGWLTRLAEENDCPIPVRLVKGAYWDTEIKRAQQENLSEYPVFTRKTTTDLSYLVCANYLLSERAQSYLYPQFATHNAHTLTCITSKGVGKKYELQRLHGMGSALYHSAKKLNTNITCRIYAPVGEHKELLPYLVRRLLENGANNSFVHKLVDPKTSVDSLAAHPVEKFDTYMAPRDARIPLPYLAIPDYLGAKGVDLSTQSERTDLLNKLDALKDIEWDGCSVLGGKNCTQGSMHPVIAPQNRQQIVGHVTWLSMQEIERVFQQAEQGFDAWQETHVADRAQMLEKLADLFEENMYKLISLCIREAGKTIPDALGEVYEAVAFCRYYAKQARTLMAEPQTLPSYTGEENKLSFEPKGIFVCISPWNFPLAIFTGQVVAALVTGNVVIAKPAEQTCLMAKYVYQLCQQAGIPDSALQLVLGDGEIGAALVADVRVAGVCFTGSCATAKAIEKTLVARPSERIATFIAETGGQNAMLVDSTALPEQVVHDVLASAFQSAGQRCSALRVLFLQDEIADEILTLLRGAMQKLQLGCPAQLRTDVGPVIDEEAHSTLMTYLARVKKQGQLYAQTPLGINTQTGYFVPPSLVELDAITTLEREYFGPVLHFVRFKRKQLDAMLASINATGYGLTLGIHSRNQSVYQHIAKQVNAGNVYINRNQIGAVVAAQPFGGCGLSGTGPKAGGPQYLQRFVFEKTYSNNTAAIGGNAFLVSLTDDN